MKSPIPFSRPRGFACESAGETDRMDAGQAGDLLCQRRALSYRFFSFRAYQPKAERFAALPTTEPTKDAPCQHGGRPMIRGPGCSASRFYGERVAGSRLLSRHRATEGRLGL